MWLGCDDAVRAYVEALTNELDRLVALLRDGRRRRGEAGGRFFASRLSSIRSTIDLERPASTRRRIRALHELAMVAEDQGWLDPSEVIVLRKLAFRVGFYLRRQAPTE